MRWEEEGKNYWSVYWYCCQGKSLKHICCHLFSCFILCINTFPFDSWFVSFFTLYWFYTITDTIESRMFFPIITLRTKSGKQGTTVSQSILKITRHTCQTMSSLVFGISTVFLSGVRFNNCFWNRNTYIYRYIAHSLHKILSFTHIVETDQTQNLLPCLFYTWKVFYLKMYMWQVSPSTPDHISTEKKIKVYGDENVKFLFLCMHRHKKRTKQKR